ncbi:hypothetical protein [Pseudomonas yamanorum]|uniref:hypothetical protein n=1 Tax=Pseudomonas yamanorum TaxID=515393 RepID=UPI003F74FD22
MPEIKERPILFSAPMVRAILEGRKTVTRRAVKVQPEVRMVDMIGPMLTFKNKRGGHWLYPNAKQQITADCPYGQIGDRLWVRETCLINDFRDGGVPEAERADCQIIYQADGPPDWEGEEELIRWRPSIHMPRWACRILLEITAVRVERLQDISDDQALAEGIYSDPAVNGMYTADGDNYTSKQDGPGRAFADLWKSTGGDWDANLWVWVVEFKRVTP